MTMPVSKRDNHRAVTVNIGKYRNRLMQIYCHLAIEFC